MRIVHNDMEGFLVDLEDQVDEGPVVRWMITRLPSEDTDGVDDVYLIASFLIDGMICEVAINTGIADKHVHPGIDESKRALEPLVGLCAAHSLTLRQGRYTEDA
jgi:hypothetical protein